MAPPAPSEPYPALAIDRHWTLLAANRVFVPLQPETENGILSFIGTTTVFGTPVDVTVAEIALECFFPADAVTADYLQECQRSPA
jgi:hypothetical protein